ncbi:hypothetical protein OS493_021169 [Desmophyllum pertusum]|uniref:Uncharacterized protein n=1 Tax=Desmophyllum pertusum TaxID=174260 RepID=A0A9X0D3P1_9CNID|nr:hypothetical protein OS493_021169 [Desmophyllum pertusum]
MESFEKFKEIFLLAFCKGQTFAMRLKRIRPNIVLKLLGWVLVAVLPETQMQYFDVETKIWTPLSSTTPQVEVTCCCYAEPVEVYDEKNNTWSVVEQKHIPSNNLGAVEIEGRVYFLINKFPFDSGIRIPPGELYPVPLDEWENLAKVHKNAVLCYLPVKRESLKTE